MATAPVSRVQRETKSSANKIASRQKCERAKEKLPRRAASPRHSCPLSFVEHHNDSAFAVHHHSGSPTHHPLLYINMFVHSSFGDGTMRFSMGGDSFAVGANGQVMSVGDSLTSECGTDFDEYVRRALEEPFPYHSMMPVSRSIENLWKNRRLRLYSDSNKFREGKVVSWCQYNMGPFASNTLWNVDIEMDSFGSGDTVIVDGLKVAKKHNGKEGRIVKFLESEGRYKVELSDDEQTTIAIKPENLKTAATTYQVNRMNIDGGGTLARFGKRSERLISLEWLEPACPHIDLDEGALKANCPVCRAVEPPLAAYDDAPKEKQDECPICLETKTCRTLQCRHEVCTDCWSKWRNSTSTIPVPPPQMDPDEIQKQRETNFQKVLGLLPHTMGGTATHANDDDETVDAAFTKFSDCNSALFEDLIEDAKGGEEGLCHFWQKLTTCAAQFLCTGNVYAFLPKYLPIPALEILILVAEEREDEIVTAYKVINRDQCTKEVYKSMVQSLICVCCNRIGELYEEVRNYRGAIPWYERSLLHAQKRIKCDDREGNVEACKDALCAQHCNLGLAQKYAALFSEALKNYDKSLQLFPQRDVIENRKTLLREMKEWTGTSGKLTPGC